MKKFIIMFAFMALVLFSCNKKQDVLDAQPETTVEYVNPIAGSFIAQEGDITLKSADLSKVTRTWSMYSNNPAFYGTSGVWTLVDGREFITGSAAYNFWKPSANNNPVTFPANQAVYSNLTPDENLRVIVETKNSDDDVAYLGVLDFNPDAVSFPLTVTGYRLGDKLTIDASQLLALPGAQNITISAQFNLAPINIDATKNCVLTTSGGAPAGSKQLTWSDIVYGTPVPTTLSVPTGVVELYDGLTDKVQGTIVITITETGNGGSVIQKTVDAVGPGHGLALTLTTTKIGWYDSGTINWSDKDITVDAVQIPVN